MAKVVINISKIEKAAQQAFKEACSIAHREIIQVISEPGAFPDFPNSDLIDTGLLRASQQPPEISGNTAQFVNTVSYSLFVYLGFTRRNGTVVKGRPWMEEGIRRADIQKTFEILFKSKL